MVMNPGAQTVETYQDRKILAFLGFAGPIISVLLAAAQGDLVAGTVLGKDTETSTYKKYVPAVAATLVTGVTADNNAILFTARIPGAAGEGIKVQLKDPSGNNQALKVTIENNVVVVSLATGGAGAITSTAADVIAAINASLYVKDILVAANSGASSGAGVVAAVAATALDNGADSNVVPELILNETVPNQVGSVNVEACLGGAFYTNMLVGMDAQARAILGARVIDSVTIVPV